MRALPLILFALLALSLGASLIHNRDDSTQSRTWVNRAMPELIAATLDDDAPRSVILGKDWTLINLFASWCAPCIAEIPILEKIAVHTNVTMVGVAWNDTHENIRAMLKEHGNPYDSVYSDNAGKTALALGIRGIPESYLIDPKGIVRYYSAGPITEAQYRDKILPIIQKNSAYD